MPPITSWFGVEGEAVVNHAWTAWHAGKGRILERLQTLLQSLEPERLDPSSFAVNSQVLLEEQLVAKGCLPPPRWQLVDVSTKRRALLVALEVGNEPALFAMQPSSQGRP